MHISATLLGDGSSDAALKPILEWLLRQHLPATATFAITVADLRNLPNPPSKSIERIRVAWDLYPSQVLFLHHDAEKEAFETRRSQVDSEMTEAFPLPQQPPPYVGVVPVKMMEAWLLGDEAAIREAANNPRGQAPLELPSKSRVETVDAKKMLFAALEKASGLNARRLKSFSPHRQRHRLAELGLERGFGHLRGIPSFDSLERELEHLITRLQAA